jgi:hypothetical protein
MRTSFSQLGQGTLKLAMSLSADADPGGRDTDDCGPGFILSGSVSSVQRHFAGVIHGGGGPVVVMRLQMLDGEGVFSPGAAGRMDRWPCRLAKCRGLDEKSAIGLRIPPEVQIFPSIRPSERYPV